MSETYNALSLRYLSASEGSAERPKAASVCSQGQPYGRPARGDIEALRTAYPCLAPRMAAKLTTPGLDPRRVLEDPRGRIALLLPDRIGPWTGHATRLRSAGFLGRRIPSPRGGTVPVTHPSWGRAGRSISEARGAGIARDPFSSRCSLLSPWGEGLPPRSCARCSRAALAQVAWREGRGRDKSIDRLQSPLTRPQSGRPLPKGRGVARLIARDNFNSPQGRGRASANP